jgi:TolA-binding protein
MDHVLFLLGDYSDRNGDAHDAANYFRRVIARHPRNAYAAEARKRLAQLIANGET